MKEGLKRDEYADFYAKYARARNFISSSPRQHTFSREEADAMEELGQMQIDNPDFYRRAEEGEKPGNPNRLKK